MSQRSTRVGGEFPDQHRYVIADALPPTDECADRRDAVRELIVGIDAHRCGCRLRDDDRARVDVIELVKAGIDIDATRRYLAKNAPQLVALFEDAVARAAAEE